MATNVANASPAAISAVIEKATYASSPRLPPIVLRPPQAAEYLGLRPSTLAKRRLRGERPNYVRLGLKSIGYEITELDAWLAECRCTSTSQGR